jgi:hypothetical protein
MERRHFLKLTLGAVAGAATLAASAQAAPLAPLPLAASNHQLPGNEEVVPAVTSADEVEHLKPEEVRWHRHWHRRWHHHWHRRWHRHWHSRWHWHRHWHHRHW